MDLNASPQPEDDDEAFESHFDESAAPEHTEHVESAVEILRRVLHFLLLCTLCIP